MRAVVPGANVKALARAVHLAARIGDDVRFESSPLGLSVEALDGSESAFCRVDFSPAFFLSFDGDALERSVSARSALAAFRSSARADARVEACEIAAERGRDEIAFELRCKRGVVETHLLAAERRAPAAGAIRLSADAYADANELTFDGRALAAAVDAFGPGDETATVEADERSFRIRNFGDGEAESGPATRTVLSLRPAEFARYSVRVAGRVAFSMRDLKSLAAFAERSDLPTTMRFGAGGEPAEFSVGDGGAVRATLLVATQRSDDRLRTVFRRCFEAAREAPSSAAVLAEDSDE